MCEKTYTNPLENTLISKYIFILKKFSNFVLRARGHVNRQVTEDWGKPYKFHRYSCQALGGLVKKREIMKRGIAD